MGLAGHAVLSRLLPDAKLPDTKLPDAGLN